MADKKKIQYKAGVLGGVTQEQADKKNAEQTTPTASTTPTPTAIKNDLGGVKAAQHKVYQDAFNEQLKRYGR